jgi:hypothetical protein
MSDEEVQPKKRREKKPKTSSKKAEIEFIEDPTKRRLAYEKLTTSLTKKFISLCCKTGCEGMFIITPKRILNPVGLGKEIKRGLDSNMNIISTKSDLFTEVDKYLAPRDFDSVVGKEDLWEKLEASEKVCVPRMVEDRSFDAYAYRGDIQGNEDVKVVKRGRPVVNDPNEKKSRNKKKKVEPPTMSDPNLFPYMSDDDFGMITDED